MRRGSGSAERREVREQEQVAPTDRVPRGEGTSLQSTIAEQRLRELWDRVNDAKLLNENWLNSDDRYKLGSLYKHKLFEFTAYEPFNSFISGLWLLSQEKNMNLNMLIHMK